MWGLGYFRTNIEDGLVRGLSSFSNLYKINYEQLTLETNLNRKMLDASGQGQAIDIGLAADFAKVFHISFSVTDMGELNWDEQVLASRFTFGEFTNALGEGLINSARFSDELKDVYQSLDFREGEDFQTPLNTHFRLNTMYRSGKRLSLSPDLILTLNKNITDVLNYQPTTFTAALN